METIAGSVASTVVGFLETFLVEWKLHALPPLVRPLPYLETFLVEWKLAPSTTGTQVTSTLETFLVEWKHVEFPILTKAVPALKPS